MKINTLMSQSGQFSYIVFAKKQKRNPHIDSEGLTWKGINPIKPIITFPTCSELFFFNGINNNTLDLSQ